ncbi:MAG: hypothetical protein K2J99_10655 [Lachnospiraceae bacterium]|nr:hypothetical protein [Lachnospiraceae bacterium]
MTLKRIAFSTIKVFIYVIILLVLTRFVYLGINSWVYDEDLLQDKESDVSVSINETESGQENKPQDDVSNRIAIVVGTATVMMTILTMVQQHINRRQDRALAFPRTVLKECQIIIGEDNVSRHTLFYNDKKGKLLIKFIFKDTISCCYVPSIYRVAVAKHPYGEKTEEYSFLNILNSFSGFGENGFSMEAVIKEPELVKEFCERQQGTYEDKLEIAMDVCWENEFFMFGFRNMSSMYLRYKIRLNDMQRNYVAENGLYGYKVENVSLERAPILKRKKG